MPGVAPASRPFMHSAHSITEICLIALGIIFTALLLMAVASTMLTIPMVRRRYGAAGIPEAMKSAGH